MDAPQPFSVGRSAVLKHLLMLPSRGWPVWVLLFVGIALIAVGCFSDVRLVVLGLMLGVAVIPAVIAFIYFSYSLSPLIVANLLPHTLERRQDGYTLRIWRRSEEDESSEGESTWLESGSINLSDSDIVTAKTTLEYEMLFFKNSQLSVLFVPRKYNY